MEIVYVLKSTVAPKSYVGMTDNLERRLAEHNSGKSYYTKRYAKRYVPWIVIYEETYKDLASAHKREKYLKSAAGRKFLKTLF